MTAIFTNYASKLLRSITLRTAIPSLRYKFGRGECNLKAGPRCAPEELAKSKCMQQKMAQMSQERTYKGMWENPECCTEPCRRDFPRLDELYYKPSDKVNRVYPRTWNECPHLKVKVKRQCCYDEIDYPPIVERNKKEVSTCKPINLFDCARFLKGPCPTISLPGCKPSRKPASCLHAKRSTGCKKLCAPYPAFSECKLSPHKKLPPKECKCITGTTMCHVWNLIRVGKLDFKPKIQLLKFD